MKTSALVLLASIAMALGQVQPPVPAPAPPAPRPAAEPGTLRPARTANPEVPAQPVPAAIPPRNVGIARPLPPPGNAVETSSKPKVNYRIRLQIKEGKESPVEISVVSCEGRIRLQMINPKRVMIDDREIPSTLDLTGTLSPMEDDKCQLTLFLGRSVPYVTGKYSGPGGQSSSQYQQMQIGLDTSVIVQLGKPLVIQSDPTQIITVILEKPAD